MVSAAKTINGVVINESGITVTGAKITLLEGKESDTAIIKGTAISGINGKFSINYQPAGPSIYNTALHLIGISDSNVGFMTVVNRNATQRVEIFQCGSITGSVRSPDGRPVQGVVIKPSLFVRDSFLGRRFMNYRSIEAAFKIQSAESDARGIFTISGLPLGWDAHLTAYINGLPITQPKDWIGQWSNTQIASPELESDANIIRATFISDGSHLESGGIIVWLYTVAEKPMPDITVTTSRTEKGAVVKGENPISVITDSEGKYKFDALKPGIYAISVFEAEQPVPIESDVEVVKNDITEVPLYAVRGTVVTGRVSDQATGKGLPGIVVASAETRPVITTKDGFFTINMLPGEGLILANGESVGYYPQGRKISIPATGKLTGIIIKLTRINKLYGKIINTDGKPVDGAWIQAMWPNDPGDLYQSDAGGNYHIITDERRSITLIAADPLLKVAALKTIKLSKGNVIMDMKLLPTASLKGIVKSSDGNVIPNAKITPLIAFDKYRLSSIENQVYTDISGGFQIRGFISGAKYMLRIRADGYEDTLIDSARIPKLISGKTASAEFRLAKKTD